MNQTIELGIFRPEPAIPQLKKKEDERKKGGAAPIPAGAGSGASAGLSAGTGAWNGSMLTTLGSGAGPRLFGLSRFWTGALRSLGFNPANSAELYLAGALFMAAVTAIGLMAFFEILGEGKKPDTFGVFPSALEPESRQGSEQLTVPYHPADFVTDGENPERPEPGAPEKAGEPTPEPAEPEAPKAPEVDAQKIAEALKKGVLKTATLSSRSGSNSGGWNVSGGGQLRDGLANLQSRAALTAPTPADAGKLKQFNKRPRNARYDRANVMRARSARAMGQLKFATDRSFGAASSGNKDSQRQFATDAFEQGKTTGGTLGATMPTDGTVVPPGNGAPDLTTRPGIPPAGQSGNKTPYQDKLNKGKEQILMALALLLMGTMLVTLGFVLMMVGKMMMASIFTKAIGMKLLALGQKLLMIGFAMIAMGIVMAMLAKGKGKQIKDDDGQKDQGKIVEYCAGESLKKKECQPRKLRMPRSTVQEDVARERNASYEMENGGPI